MSNAVSSTRVRFLAVFPALCALLAGTSGCDPQDEPSTYGLASIEFVTVHVNHGEGETIGVNLSAGLTKPNGESPGCPTLAPDLTITANGAPMSVGLDDSTHTITFSCGKPDLHASTSLPVTGGPLRIEISQGGQTAVIAYADVAWPTIGPVSLSATSAAVGEAFSIDVAASTPTAAGGLAYDRCWGAFICPRDNPTCTAWEGGAVLEISKIVPRGADSVRMDLQVPTYAASGPKALTVERFDCELTLRATACSGVLGCSATNGFYGGDSYGPFNFDVL